MQLSTIIFAATAFLSGSALAMPGQLFQRSSVSFFNGEKSIVAEVEEDLLTARDLLQTRTEGDIDCKGSAFCERLGSSCDDAYRKVVPGNTYSAYLDDSDTGTCSGTCGLFVSGDRCSATGQELQEAYDEIRSKGSCTHCGRKEMKDGCFIKIDRVTGC
ncbi:hypothetical protein P168DRAFT_279494 [Aspergillus campestris IBT 28561]|uniref:Uncharacterized protein n=1 Tax=Aspergillus campestris (strain IBT 28561) TaxID=1392248 RepID=A0A2I1DCC2_ASPC2|nr:uncharacterized protein P168DRAFT_279494 [Aspergillus campestris IBT 28561]PKY07527.1 hypothetical protein P168DRAFT_279494 [Aspergillus campestris IBT 28561]